MVQIMVKSREELASLKCIPCKGNVPPLRDDKIQDLSVLVSDWRLDKKGPDKLVREYKFKDFTEAMDFVNKVAELAEQEGHHPDIFIHWNEVTLTFWTHAINGLFNNDFIMAAKVDKLLE